MNNKYVIRVTDPLLRSGIEIETEASERYLVPVLNTLMEKVREFNKEQEASVQDKQESGSQGSTQKPIETRPKRRVPRETKCF